MPTSQTVTADSAFDTLTLEECKQHLRLWSDDFDQEVLDALSEAIDYCERQVGRTLRTAVTRQATYHQWSDLGEFDWQPVISITSVKYVDTSDVEQTVASSEYRLLASDNAAARLELDTDFTRPSVANQSDAIRVVYTTGYATAAAVPPAAKRAIKLMLTIFWGDLSPQQTETWQRRADAVLQAIDWGSYR